MVEAPQNRSTEELLERIARLEYMTANLQAQLDDLGKAFLKELDDRVEASWKLSQFLEDYLWPVIDKLFPAYRNTLEQIDAVLKRRPSDNKTKERR